MSKSQEVKDNSSEVSRENMFDSLACGETSRDNENVMAITNC